MPTAKPPTRAQSIIADLMNGGPHGALTQAFVLVAVEQQAVRIARMANKPRDYDDVMPTVPWEIWHGIARDILARIRQHRRPN
jgi:hypothetical protein